MVFVQSTGMSEFEFIECNAIHVPVQCVVNASIGALFKSNRFDLVRHWFLCTYLVYLPCDLNVLVHGLAWI
jgi:hypothetical protein